MTRKHSDASSVVAAEEVHLRGNSLNGHSSDRPMSLRERRQAAHGRVSGRQKRSEQTQLEEIHELSAEELVEAVEEGVEAVVTRRQSAQQAPPKASADALFFPALGRATPASIKAPIIAVDAHVDVLEQNTETATRLLSYDTAIEGNPLLQPPPLPGEADDTAVDVKMDADFLATLQAIQSQTLQKAPVQPTPDARAADAPANIWTSDFGSSPEPPDRQHTRRVSDTQEEPSAIPPREVEAPQREHTLTRRPPQPPTQPRPPSPTHAAAQNAPAAVLTSYPSNLSLQEREPTPLPLRPISLKDSSPGEGVGSTVDIKAPRHTEQQSTLPPTKTHEEQVEVALHNRTILRAFQAQDQYVYLHFDAQGQLSLADEQTNANDLLFAFPTFDKHRLLSMSVPIGFVQDDMGALCEAHLVLAKARKDAPMWSRAIAELQATSAKTLQFKKWLTVSQEDLAHLNQAQKIQLALLLDDTHFDRVLRNEERPQSVAPKKTKATTNELPQLTDADIIDTNPRRKRPSSQNEGKEAYIPRHQRQKQRLPSKILHPASMTIDEDEGPGPTNPLAPAHPDRRPVRPSPAMRSSISSLFQDLPVEGSANTAERRSHTLSHSGHIPLVSATQIERDDTAMRRIRVDAATLDPNALQLHIKIPRKLTGKWFKGSEETLSIYGRHRELKLPQLGITIQFTFSQSPQGKVFPQVALTRSTNVKNITFADHTIEIYANRNPQNNNGWDHIQQLPRGHMAQIDLSPTDQIRGILELYVHHDEHGLVDEPIQMSWSVKE